MVATFNVSLQEISFTYAKSVNWGSFLISLIDVERATQNVGGSFL